MEGGGWRVEGGGWRVEGGRWRIYPYPSGLRDKGKRSNLKSSGLRVLCAGMRV